MVDRHPGLAPNWHIRSGCFPRYDKPAHTTRDQTYGETPSRFTSESADKMARHIVGAGPPSQKELNDSYVAHWARDDGAAPLGAPGVNKRGGMTEARSNDPSEAFASELNAIPSGQPQAALNCFNRAYHGAKTSDARDKIERVFRDWQSSYDARGDNPWKPRQAAHDAPWSNLYSQNASVIGSDPNKISPGMKLDVGGGQSHTVAAGETLSGIAQQYSGGAGGIHPLASEGGGASPTGGNYSSGGDLKSGEGNPLQGMGPGGGGPKTLLGGGGTTSSSSGSGSGSGNVPTPPVKPSEYGGAGGNNETGMGGAGKGPTTLLGGGGEASGGNYSSNASLKTGEGWPSGSSSAYPTGGAPSGGAGEGLKPLASEGGSGGTTSDAKKPRGRK
jgi:LysM repeat protein